MEIRDLRYFLAVADELHFGRAAAKLHISQPPLTQHIKKLEADLDVRLFDRNKRSVKLTNAGVALVDEARRLVNDAESLKRLVQNSESGDTGLLRAGFMSAAPLANAREFFICLTQELPGISVAWHGLTTSEQIQALHLKQIDLGFVHLPADCAGLKVLPIVSDQLVIAVYKSHPLANRKTAELKNFSQDRFILPPRSSAPGLYDLMIATCNAAGFSPIIPHRARDMISMVSLVSVGSGVSIVPRWLAGAGFPDVRFLTITGRVPTVQLALAWNPGNTSSVLQRALIALQDRVKKALPPARTAKLPQRKGAKPSSA